MAILMVETTGIKNNIPLPPTFPEKDLNGLILYHIIAPEYFPLFLSKGKIQLKTLFEYQKIECINRRDASDGELGFIVPDNHFHNTKVTESTSKATRELASCLVDENGQPANVDLITKKCSVLYDVSKISLVYCLTAHPTTKLTKKFGTYKVGENYKQHRRGKVLRITDLSKFKNLLDSKVCDIYQCQPSVLRHVDYTETMGPDTDRRYKLHPAFTKDIEFAEETEWRLVWTIKLPQLSINPTPLQIEIGSLNSCVKLVSERAVKYGVSHSRILITDDDKLFVQIVNKI